VPREGSSTLAGEEACQGRRKPRPGTCDRPALDEPLVGMSPATIRTASRLWRLAWMRFSCGAREVNQDDWLVASGPGLLPVTAGCSSRQCLSGPFGGALNRTTPSPAVHAEQTWSVR
jgi:hypothetical protein